ncbi:hypothetical protein GCM10028806_41980 [Spirosoma terrae]
MLLETIFYTVFVYMQQRSIVFLGLVLIASGCAFGTYPMGGTGGQQYPDDSYPGSGGQPSAGHAEHQVPTVNSIRVTQDYTILDLTYVERGAPKYDPRDPQRRQIPTGEIAIDPAGHLIAANGARMFAFVKAEGIPVKREQIDRNTGKKILLGTPTYSGQRYNFRLYFERLDKGLEHFDLFECSSDQYYCWNMYDLYVDNPADPIVHTPTPVPPKPSSPTKPTKLPEMSGETGGEMESPKTKPAPAPTLIAVSGVVSDVKNKRPVTATISYQFSASKQAVDSVQSFASTGAYKMNLVKGQVYTYIASARGYQAANGVLDLSKAVGGQKLTRDIALTPLAVGDKITLKNVYFDMSKADLLSASYAELNKLVAMMHDNPNMTIRLEGHTDIIGDHDKNLQLSRDRVIACQRYLVQKGIDIDRIQTIGYGDTRPILTKGTDEERKVNRRVEFVILII